MRKLFENKLCNRNFLKWSREEIQQIDQKANDDA